MLWRSQGALLSFVCYPWNLPPYTLKCKIIIIINGEAIRLPFHNGLLHHHLQLQTDPAQILSNGNPHNWPIVWRTKLT